MGRDVIRTTPPLVEVCIAVFGGTWPCWMVPMHHVHAYGHRSCGFPLGHAKGSGGPFWGGNVLCMHVHPVLSAPTHHSCSHMMGPRCATGGMCLHAVWTEL
jgi:hypothetical protein